MLKTGGWRKRENKKKEKRTHLALIRYPVIAKPFPAGSCHSSITVEEVALTATGTGDTPLGILGCSVVALFDLGPYEPVPTELIPATTKLWTVDAASPVTTYVVETLPVFVTTTVGGVLPSIQFCTPLTNLTACRWFTEECEEARGGTIGVQGAWSSNRSVLMLLAGE